MARPATLLAAALALCLLLAPTGLAWYKTAAGPSLYSVGRAAGLLSGLRRSLDARRAESPVGAGPPVQAAAFPELRPRLRSLVSASARGAGRRRILCVKDVTPKLQSCERLPDGHATLQCKADVFLSLRAADCRST